MPEPLSAKLSGGPTVGELARRFLEEHVAVRYKPSTMAVDPHGGESSYRARPGQAARWRRSAAHG